jgi:hypothetical protein
MTLVATTYESPSPTEAQPYEIDYERVKTDAMGVVGRLRRSADRQEVSGNVPASYFVVTNPYHRAMHKIFASELGITEVLGLEPETVAYVGGISIVREVRVAVTVDPQSRVPQEVGVEGVAYYLRQP